ncbi:MAG TPA: HAMP domain-containing sensor histidine kinase [Solirubrobacteraceae bacterium]|nr:HAMP domain-containing sensor histidine kinase [Solirubrobacteraceae bacterium]
MRRRLPRGLRPRLLLALLLTSAVTLGIAATVLLSPLPDRLREQSATNLRGAVLASRPAVEKALKDSAENEFALQGVAEELRQRTDGRVVLFGPVLPGDVLYDTSTGASIRGATLTSLHTQRTGSTSTNIAGDVVRIGVRLFSDKGGVVGVLVVERRLTEVTTAVDQVRNALLAAGAVGLLVAVALAVALSSTLLRRLGRLRTAAVRISQEGIVEAPLQHDEGRDEVGDLARAFGRMQEELRRQEQARRSFVATASHELRTPLTMLQGTMELLEEDLADGRLDIADAQTQVARARRELLRLSSLAGELLDLSRLDASVPLRSEPVELGELVRAVAAEFALRADERDVALEVVPPPGPCWSRGDPDAVARVVRILIDNALRYGPRSEPISVAVGCVRERSHVEVADRGPGVHPAEREQIFERFQRGRSASTEAGFGLGLAIGRELAERMGGTLALVGEDGQRGTRFRLELPAAEPGAEPLPEPGPATASRA